MNKELSPLEALDTVAFIYGYDENIKIIEKQLKALEIIKEKQVDVFWFIACLILLFPDAREKYNNETNGYELTEEEFELLKEILK